VDDDVALEVGLKIKLRLDDGTVSGELGDKQTQAAIRDKGGNIT
jgi:hypothetical protein